MEKYINYVNEFQCNNLEEVKLWINNNLTNYLKNNNENQTEIEHILDYLSSNKAPKRLKKMSYIQAISNSEKWMKTLIKKGEKISENSKDTKIILELKNDFKWVQLVGQKAFEREGFLMRHCVANYYGKDNIKIYSLRDQKNIPHCTIEESKQIKGKGNGNISPKYIGYVVEFLTFLGMEVSDNEMKNLGYFNYEKYKEDLHEDCLNQAYKEYLPISSKLLDKNKKPYFNLDLIVDLGLIDSDGKIIVDLNLLDYGIKRLLNSQNASSGYNSQNASSGNNSKNASSGDYSKNASSGYNSQNASSGDNSQNASSGDYSKNASSGNNSKNASSGYNSQNASSGYNSQNASSGDNSQNASSGDYSKNASSGDYSQNASSGDYSQNASSGNNSQNASSGYNSQNASSGNNSQNASSGDYSQNASSGNYSQDEVKGLYSIVASIGRESKVKGIIGTWITLAEYEQIDGEYRVKIVKTEQIDGVNIKENTYYTLKYGKFTEVK